MIGADHYEAVELLKASGQTLDMVVGREALKPILQVPVRLIENCNCRL